MNLRARIYLNGKRITKLPSPTGVKYYELYVNTTIGKMGFEFPSPTGVKYYELCAHPCLLCIMTFKSFRPQQGLSIMNFKMLLIRLI